MTGVLTLLGTLAAIFLGGRAEGLKLRAQYWHKERGRLRDLIGEYHGRLLEAAVDWDRRMFQLYNDGGGYLRHEDGPLDRHEYADSQQYLFRSYVFRLLSLCAIARKFETHAFYIDARSRIARQRDLDFLKYAKAFLWAMTHANLTPNDGMPGRDHFPNDQFRPLLDLCYRPDVDVPLTQVANSDVIFDFRRFDGFSKRVAATEEDPEAQEWADLRKTFDLVNGLRRDDWIEHEDGEGEQARYRWDRLVALHLLTIGFINTFGYDWQRKTDDDIALAARQFRYACIAREFARAGRQLGLANQREMKRVAAAAGRHAALGCGCGLCHRQVDQVPAGQREDTRDVVAP